MLKLALEIPTSMLETLEGEVDLHFALAHKVLADPLYAKFFAKSKKEVILDNSTHEFGTPLPVEELLSAVRKCKANWLIAPDIVVEPLTQMQFEKNLAWLQQTYKSTMSSRNRVGLGAVACGESERDRKYWYRVAGKYADMICFSFHDSRRLFQWRDFILSYSHYGKRVHVLGVSTLDEMKRWYDISEQFKEIPFSIDTTKATKWGVQGKKIEQLQSLRGGKINAKQVLELPKFTSKQLDFTLHNISVLRNICRGRF